MKHAPSHPTHPRFQAAAFSHCEADLSGLLWNKKPFCQRLSFFAKTLHLFNRCFFQWLFLYHLAVFFSKTLHRCSSSFFQRLFVFMTCLSFFSKTHHLFNTSFFQRFIVSIACLSFFSKTHHLFNTSFFQRVSRYNFSFSQRASVFFTKTHLWPHLFCKD